MTFAGGCSPKLSRMELPGDYLLATGARCSPKPRRMTFAGGCSPMLSRMELPGGITFAPQAPGVPLGLPSRHRRSMFPGDYLRATGARCSPGGLPSRHRRPVFPGDYLRATGARCSPGITFAPQALGVPRGGGFSSKNAKQQGATFYDSGPGKQACLFSGQLP